MDTMTVGLAKELGPDGVRVNGVRPGLIDTEIHASGGRPDRAAALGAATPLGRAGTAEEVAEAIVWLLSDAASYVNGAILDVERRALERPQAARACRPVRSMDWLAGLRPLLCSAFHNVGGNREPHRFSQRRRP